MREFQERNQERKLVKRRMYSKTSLIILALILFFMAKGVYAVYEKERESRTEVERIAKQKAELQQRYDFIQEKSDHLKSTDGIEAEIRSKFDVVKEGEGLIVIVDKNVTTIEEDRRGVLKKFWDSVVGVFRRDGADVDEKEKAEKKEMKESAPSVDSSGKKN
jgi:cell division protein FtsB